MLNVFLMPFTLQLFKPESVLLPLSFSFAQQGIDLLRWPDYHSVIIGNNQVWFHAFPLTSLAVCSSLP